MKSTEWARVIGKRGFQESRNRFAMPSYRKIVHDCYKSTLYPANAKVSPFMVKGSVKGLT